jgi:hypothetical protein
LLLVPSQNLKGKKDEATINTNREILKKMEVADVIKVEEEIRKKQEQVQGGTAKDSFKVTTKVDSRSNKEYFENDVFIGDSITEELEFYNALNKSSVLSKKGNCVLNGKSLVSSLQNIKPKRIFLLYGLNDLDMFQDVSDFKRNYISLIETIKQKLPNSKIFIQSSLPVQEKAVQENKNYSQDRMMKFVQAEEELAKEEGVIYIDIRPVVKGNESLYEQDGAHFKPKFCELWLNFIKSYLENNIK